MVALVAGCSGGPSLQEVTISDLGEPGWEMVVDGEMDEEMVSFLQSVSDSEAADISEEVGEFWLRLWMTDTGLVSIMLAEPGGLPNVEELAAILVDAGMVPTTDYGDGDLVMQVDWTDDDGPGLGLVVAKEGHFALFSFVDEFSEELVDDTVARQLAAIPEYDDQYRGVMIAFSGVAFVIAVWFAAKSLNRNSSSPNAKEPETT